MCETRGEEGAEVHAWFHPLVARDWVGTTPAAAAAATAAATRGFGSMLRRVPNKVTRRVRESIYDVDDDSGGVHSQVRDQVCVLCT